MILFFEDGQGLSEILGDLLRERISLTPLIANDSVSAMLAFSNYKDQIKLVIFDLAQCAEQDSLSRIEMLSIIKKMCPHIKALSICRKDDPFTLEQITQLGVKEKIFFPYQTHELVAHVTRLLA